MSKRLPGRAALFIVEPGVDLGPGQTMHAPVSAQHLGHPTPRTAGQQQQELRCSRARARMRDQHRASLGQKPAHGRHARIYRLNFQSQLTGGILDEGSQGRTVSNVRGRILQARRPSLRQQTLGHGDQSIAQPAGWPSCGRRDRARRSFSALAGHMVSPDGRRSSICPFSSRRCRHSGPSRRARARTSAASKLA